ncbi:M24 family metallopeptidase [Jiangella rhizosphaerae]|uniref:M24 family metallopeptidase n=1 Tax=Jiangella rhizosphaerae TaxID=2293569 RepID=UPI001313D805|nr:M24 family metallopeptidase [Jiangella rhizosphaerae]
MTGAGSRALLLDPPPLEPSPATRLPLEWHRARADELRAAAAERGARAVLLTDPWNIVHFTGLWAATTERPLYALLEADGAPFWFYPRLDRDLVRSWWYGGGAEYFDYPHVDGQHPNEGTAARGPAVDLWEKALRLCVSRGYGAGSLLVDRPAGGSLGPLGPLGSIGDVCLRSRMVKTPEELALARRAYAYFDDVHVFCRDTLLDGFHDGMTDFELRSAMIDMATRRIVPDLGLDGGPHRGVGVSIDLGWVRAGRVTGYPHPNQFRYSEITRGGTLQASGVIRVGGYGGECYRPFMLAPRTAHMERLWTVARDSCLLQQDAMRAGVTCGEVAEKIHRFQIDAGVREYVYHRPAHGQGPEGHQPPWLALGDDTVLEPGMCLSVEPGLYDPRAGFSVNFSDMFVVQESGPALQLSRVPWTTEWCWLDF